MSQLNFALDGGDPIYVDYPQQFNVGHEVTGVNFGYLDGSQERDFRLDFPRFYYPITIQWDALYDYELEIIMEIWLYLTVDSDRIAAMAAPDGLVYYVKLSPDNVALRTTRFAGNDGYIYYTATMNLVGYRELIA